MILALLALVVMGLAAAASLQNKQIEAKRASGLAEASVLESLRNAAQAAVYEHLAQIQQGLPIEKAGIVITPSSASGELRWSPTVPQLRDMGFLPAGWSATRSSLNEGAYSITFRRVPAGCDPAACDVDGLVLLGAPVLDTGRNTPVDGVVIGPILTRAGADGGVSLPTAPATISGFHGTWTAPNPVPGTPAGVVAMRFGTQTGGFSQFVRIGDLRDPALRGNLSATGDLNVGGRSRVVGRSLFEDEIHVGNESNPCFTATPAGVVAIRCLGQINARAADLQDESGGRTEVSPQGVTTNGKITSVAGFSTLSTGIFEESDPSAIRIDSGELNIRSLSSTMASFRENGMFVPSHISTSTLNLDSSVEEGAPCDTMGSPGLRFGATVDRGLAMCIDGRWIATSRHARAGAPCAATGVLATDLDDRQSLICRAGLFVRTAAMLSNFTLADTVSIDMSAGPTRVQKPDCRPNGVAGAEPLIILTPNNEDVLASTAAVMSGVNRYAVDEGDSWMVYLERSADRSFLAGNLIGQLYCYYP